MDEPTPTPTPTDLPTPTPTPVPEAVMHYATLTADQWFVVQLFMALVIFCLGLMVVAAWRR